MIEDKIDQYLINEIVKKYPELDAISYKLFNYVINEINKQVKNIESEMPYKAQYVLEKLIYKLEQSV